MTEETKTQLQLEGVAKYSDLMKPEHAEEVQRIFAGMTAGGFMVSADGKSRPPTRGEKFALAMVAHKFGLDPLMGEIYIMGGRPYPAFKAIYRAAVARGFVVESRPMSDDERSAYQIEPDEFAWLAVVNDADGRKVSDDFGTASVDDVAIARGKGGRRILRHMAQKRAERRAIDKAMGVTTYDSEDPIKREPFAVKTSRLEDVLGGGDGAEVVEADE